MIEKDFQVDGKEFKLRKINAIAQFHLVRRMAPILGELAPVLGKFAKSAKSLESASQDVQLEMAAQFIGPVMNGLSKLSDDDADKVLYGLLNSVEIKQSTGNWANISNGNMLMIQDLELPALMNLAGRAFMYNLSSFFNASPKLP